MSEICRCGHARSLHHARPGECVFLPNDKPLSWWCGCKAFAAQEREPQPGVGLEPTITANVTAAVPALATPTVTPWRAPDSSLPPEQQNAGATPAEREQP